MVDYGATEFNVLRYEDFLNGKLPLPLEEYSCPAQFLQNYGKKDIDSGCIFSSYYDCKKYGTKECWDSFYNNAKTYEEKQLVLRKMK